MLLFDTHMDYLFNNVQIFAAPRSSYYWTEEAQNKFCRSTHFLASI